MRWDDLSGVAGGREVLIVDMFVECLQQPMTTFGQSPKVFLVPLNGFPVLVREVYVSNNPLIYNEFSFCLSFEQKVPKFLA